MLLGIFYSNTVISLVVSGFGLIGSLCWILANRGSKYWQENWEKKIEKYEIEISENLFKKKEKIQDKGPWLRARRYSVSVTGSYSPG